MLQHGFQRHSLAEYQELLPPLAQGRLQGEGLGTPPVLRRDHRRPRCSSSTDIASRLVPDAPRRSSPATISAQSKE